MKPLTACMRLDFDCMCVSRLVSKDHPVSEPEVWIKGFMEIDSIEFDDR